ncbi:YitT family protein [Shouchella sp. 1P09AA]|uniref:YitT family protein n=1 Tax=unclassified Shouchella TaxID=2893065 RepID=UPI0039A37909
MKQVSELRSYSLIILGTFIVALAFNLFMLPASLAAGGVSGISIILNDMYGFTPAVVQLIINVPLFFVGFAILGKSFSAKTLVGTFILPVFIWLTSFKTFSVTDPFLASVYGGILFGVGLGLVFKGNGSTGGTTIISQIMRKYFNISSGFAQLIIDGVIVVAAMIVFNLELALYAMVALFIGSKVIDFVLLRSTNSKLVLIITEHDQFVTDMIYNEIDRGVTKVWSEGGYSKTRKSLLFTVVDQAEAVYLKELIQAQDANSFVVFLSASEIIGKGFSLPKS